MNYITMMSLSNCLVTGSTLHLGFLLPGLGFHGHLRRQHEDADAYADAITELCRVGYPQSSPELRQELISELFVRGQSYPELKKYLWVVIRTQKERKLQTLIEVRPRLAIDRRSRYSRWRKTTTQRIWSP